MKVKIQLVRSTTVKQESTPVDFEYISLDSGRPFRSFKRLKDNYGLFHRILGLDAPAGAVAEELPHKKVPISLPQSLANEAITSTIDKSVISNQPAPPSQPPNLNAIPSVPVYSRPDSQNSSVRVRPVQPRPVAPESTKPSSSPPPGLAPDSSIDDIKHRLTVNLDKRRAGASPMYKQPIPQGNKFWSDEVSVYSENDLLDEVLSQGSVNDLLSAVGEGFTVYEDIEGLNNENGLLPDGIPNDALYGDASYNSCYSNMEFVMDRARAANVVPIIGGSSINAEAPPVLPPKKGSKDLDHQIDDDMGEYGTPSSRPIHANKLALLKERGFGTAQPKTTDDTNTYYNLKSFEDLVNENKEPEKPADPAAPVLDLFV